ncbi:MAG: hypothetical protein ABI882_23170 [Acidobacteriota bacterium]
MKQRIVTDPSLLLPGIRVASLLWKKGGGYDMPVISDHQQKRDERILAGILIVLNLALLAALFTVSYIQS